MKICQKVAVKLKTKQGFRMLLRNKAAIFIQKMLRKRLALKLADKLRTQKAWARFKGIADKYTFKNKFKLNTQLN